MSDTKGHLDMDLLRFTTAGSVDDGKSTLIGRLLYDSKSIFEDQLEAVEQSSKQRGDEIVNLALLTDGLRAEREQGITIDVAYRYFATPRRKFIIADTPGHIQYTRNMVTGASTANLAIILIDVRKGVIEQTCRHSFIASLLQIQHIIVAVNKMDLVAYQEDMFLNIMKDYKEFSSRLSVPHIDFIPISALHGDNIVKKSTAMPWYQGGTLLYTLESVYIGNEYNHIDARFPVQWVIRPQSQEHHDIRRFAGRVASGVFKNGDEVTILPSGFRSRIQGIHTMGDTIDEAFAPMSVALTLEDETDISRGDMIVKQNNPPQVTQDIESMICWFSETAKLQTSRKYILRSTTKETKCMIKEVKYLVDVNTLHKIEDNTEVGLNDIARISIRSSAPLFVDPYTKNRATGSLILIDEQTHATVAAGMVV
ncbi:MAG: Bifunctional enzyme CysN/CysC [Verrucomicrobia subdivision 3 bacterium]|nr:Bifunctional enzyme CysN/CysC [Limisphaerales bacterium]MCS1414184.1 Bifunctional enzyme CysN/CysC [Limisphaerales bacterium]